jgi:hypothetical protein
MKKIIFLLSAFVILATSCSRTITLIHDDPDGSTCLADSSGGRVINDSIQVAS